MIYANTIQVLDESCPRMTQSKLYTYSHSKSGYSFYELVLNQESKNEDMEFIEETLTRQGIPFVIYPDRLTDNVIIVRFDSQGEIIRSETEYYNIMSYPQEISNIAMSTDITDVTNIKAINSWDNQIQNGNIYSLKQFMK